MLTDSHRLEELCRHVLFKVHGFFEQFDLRFTLDPAAAGGCGETGHVHIGELIDVHNDRYRQMQSISLTL